MRVPLITIFQASGVKLREYSFIASAATARARRSLLRAGSEARPRQSRSSSGSKVSPILGADKSLHKLKARDFPA
ncbi:MAG: hypothetical protein LBW85_11485 [Deltaproteobacteria bacterium]|nr:hypothetical protein [Deltaproteobacteria bacterium]